MALQEIINKFMQYLTNYYKNLAENLQKKVDNLEKQLSLLEGKAEMDAASKTNKKPEGHSERMRDTAKTVPLDIKKKEVSAEEKAKEEKEKKEMELPEAVIHEIAEVPGKKKKPEPKKEEVKIPQTGSPMVDDIIKTIAQIYGKKKS